MVGKVFISYRRDDSRYQARIVYAAFTQVIPREHVFMDIDSIPLGSDFRKVLKGWVDQCDVLLALIGPNWINVTDPRTGQRRLENPADFVRIEIAEALARGIPVVPVLLDGTHMPDPSELPDDLQELVYRHAEFVEYARFDYDVARLIRKLQPTPSVTASSADAAQALMPEIAAQTPTGAHPATAQTPTARSGRALWNGEFYVNYWPPHSRSWDDAVEFGFVSGGYGSWYSKTLSLLSPGDRIWVKAGDYGFVGVGRVTGRRVAARDFRINGRPALEVLTRAEYARQHAEDDEKSEYFVPVRWLQTVTPQYGLRGPGLFGIQHTVCRPRTQVWAITVDALKLHFPHHEG